MVNSAHSVSPYGKVGLWRKYSAYWSESNTPIQDACPYSWRERNVLIVSCRLRRIGLATVQPFPRILWTRKWRRRFRSHLRFKPLGEFHIEDRVDNCPGNVSSVGLGYEGIDGLDGSFGQFRFASFLL